MPWVSSGTWTRGVRGWVLWRSAHRCLVGSVLRATPGKGRGSKGVVQSWSEMAERSLILLLPPVPDQSLDAGSPEVNDGWRAKAACRQPSRPRTPSPSLKGDLDTLCRPQGPLGRLAGRRGLSLGGCRSGQGESVVQAECSYQGHSTRREACALPWDSPCSQPWDSDLLEGCGKRARLALKGTCRKGGIREGDLASAGTHPSTYSSAIDESFHFLGFNVLLLL